MTIWALADLHLAKSVPSKDMAVFGPAWEGYMDKMERAWRSCVDAADLILLPGDISWAMKLEDAQLDFEWIDSLPGTKLMIRGNHDYWWSSSKKMAEKLPSSVHFIQNTAFHWNDVAIAGSRLWDTPEYRFDAYIHFQENRLAKTKEEPVDEAAIFQRELQRLRLSLQQMNPSARLKIVMTHYPPISADLCSSRVSALLEEFGVHICVFGHLHNVKKDVKMFGEKEGVHYRLTAADYLDFKPLQIS